MTLELGMQVRNESQSSDIMCLLLTVRRQWYSYPDFRGHGFGDDFL